MDHRARRGLAAIGGAAATLATALAAGLAGPAQAAGAWQTHDELQGTLTWTTLGPVAGQPGNAHTGLLVIDTDEDYAGFQIIDWSCPQGVVPPTALDESGPCVVRRDRELFQRSAMTYPGPVAVSFDGAWDVVTARYEDGAYVSSTESQTDLHADVGRVGPLQRTFSTSVGDGLEHRTTTYTAPMRLRGRILDITLPSPRSSQSSRWTRTTDRFRDVS